MRDELPLALSWMNLVSAGLALLGMLYLTIRRWRADRNISRLLVLDLIAVSVLLVSLGGAAYQTHLIPASVWEVAGFVGRILALAGVAALVLQGVEHIPVLDPPRHMTAEAILRQAREQAAALLASAAEVAAEKVRADAATLAAIELAAAETAANTRAMVDSTLTEISVAATETAQNTRVMVEHLEGNGGEAPKDEKS